MRIPHILGHCGMCGLTILCGTCGNNQCNATRGFQGTCTDCDSAQALFQRCFSQPLVYSEVRATREEIRTWQARQLENLLELAGADDPNWLVEQAISIGQATFGDLVELERALRATEDPR